MVVQGGNDHSTITPKSGRGGIWTVASFRHVPAHAHSARAMCRAWGGADPGAVGGAASILRISWDEAWGLMERAVQRGRARKAARIVRQIGVDEKAATKGHRYLTLVCDLDEGTVGTSPKTAGRRAGMGD
jgi:hypothetical protein